MNRLSYKLAAILGLQLAVAAIFWAGGPDYSAFKAKEPLLTFDASKVDRIEVAETGGGSVTLVKEGGGWGIPASANFPADSAKVNGFLAKIGGLKKGWPVASTTDAARRFKVTSDTFERRIALKGGGVALGEMLIGASPNFKAVSARSGSDNNVYNVAFSTYEAAARADEWMDHSLLNITQDKIASISIGDAVLERKDGKFVLAGLGKDQKQDETATYRLVGALAYPVFDAVAGKGPDALDKVKDPDITATIKLTEAAPVVLKYKKDPAGGAYLFTTSANGFLFRASEASAEPIVKAKREALIEAPKKAGAGSSPAEAGKPAKADAPVKAGGKEAQAVTKPTKEEEPAKAAEDGAETREKAAIADEPAKIQEESAGAAKVEDAGKSEDERFQAAMQPEKVEEPKKSGDAAVKEPQGGAAEDHSGASAKPEKPAEGQPTHGG